MMETNTLTSLIGQTVHVGAARIKIHAETKPFGELDKFYPGLRAALTPQCRSGVYGEIVEDGIITIGDDVTIAM